MDKLPGHFGNYHLFLREMMLFSTIRFPCGNCHEANIGDTGKNLCQKNKGP
jgi:hypothetical protein